MNTFRKISLLSIFAVSLLGSSSTATASSSAQATIDWSSLNIQFFDLSNGLNAPSFNWTSRSGYSNASSTTYSPYEYQNSYKSANDFNTILSSNAATTSSQSSGLRTEDLLQASADGIDNNFTNYASAGSSNSGNFSVTGHGIALITFDWHLSISGNGPHYWDDYGNSSVNIYGYYSDNNGNNGSGSTSVGISNYAANDLVSRDGTFALSIFSDGIHTSSGNIRMELSASTNISNNVSQVPVPATAWLFASGLLGFLGLRRRPQSI